MEISQITNSGLMLLKAVEAHELLGGILALSGIAIFLYSIQQYRGSVPWVQRRADRKQAAITGSATKKLPKDKAVNAPNKDETIAVLQQRLDWQNTAIGLLGERILALEEYLEMVGSRQQSVARAKEDQQYLNAIQLIEKGANARQLASECGISPSEAELLMALHKKRA